MNGESHTTPISWKAIAGKIRKQRAILVLGPEAYRAPDGDRSLREALLESLNVKKNPCIQKYYRDDGFFLFSRGGGRAFTCERIEEFYRKQPPEETLLQLARIPFHVILSVTPDKLLPRAFDQLDFHYQFDFYKKRHEPSSIKEPTVGLPLLYNLFGCIDDEESLVLTHNDLYDYFKSIFARRSMPERLKHALQQREINCFIFLGVPFDKWYMQLLLRELEIHRNSEDFIRYAANQVLTDEVKTFCTEQFTINFVDTKIPEFIRQLYAECKTQGILRQASTGDRWQQLKSLVAKGDLDRALNLFGDLAKGTELEAEAVGIAGRHRRFRRKEKQGVLYGEQVAVQENQISASLMELINEAQAL